MGGAEGVGSEDKDEEEGVDVEEKFETLVEANDTLLERVVRGCTVNLNLMEFSSLVYNNVIEVDQRRLVMIFYQYTLTIICNVHLCNPGQPAESAKTVPDIWCVLIIVAFHENRDQPPLVLDCISRDGMDTWGRGYVNIAFLS